MKSLITLVYGVNESSVISVLIHSSVSGAPETHVSFNVPRWTSIIQYRLYLHPHTLIIIAARFIFHEMMLHPELQCVLGLLNMQSP